MKIGVDGNAITLDGEIASYDEARAAAEKIFGFASVLWPEESAAHDAEIEAETRAPKTQGSWRPEMSMIREVKPGTNVEKVYQAWQVGMRDKDAIAAHCGLTTNVVAIFLGKMRKGGLIE